MALLIVCVLIGLIPAAIAANKGGNFVLWWIYGAALFIIALPHAIFMRPTGNLVRKCPFCAENVKVEASVCPHCQRDIIVKPAAEPA